MKVICDVVVCKAVGLALLVLSKILNIWPLGILNLRARRSGITYFRNNIMPKEFDWKRSYGKMSRSFKKYGFKVPQLYSDCYSQWNGIVHDRYLSTDLYYNYILPCLNRYDFIVALLDKGFYGRLFSDFRQPKTVACCRNGIYYTAGEKVTSLDEVAKLIAGRPDLKMIVKPMVASSCGHGIGVLESGSEERIKEALSGYGTSYIIQERLSQHPEMARLNPTSLNTLRVFTYRSLDKTVHFVEDSSIVRFGSAGTFIDNALAGGGFCAVDKNGNVDDVIFQDRTSRRQSLRDSKGIVNFKIPGFEKVKTFVRQLHDRLPYFDWIGWDIAINADGDPTFIEFNISFGCEAPQTTHGDIFGPYFDEIIQRVQKVKHTVQIAERQDWGAGFRRLEGVVTW